MRGSAHAGSAISCIQHLVTSSPSLIKAPDCLKNWEMIPEARLDRLERMAMLLVRAGYHPRSELRASAREHDEKINHLIELQIHMKTCKN
jgi:hypothetical protein